MELLQHNMFVSPLWVVNSDLDLELIIQNSYHIKDNKNNIKISNVNGYHSEHIANNYINDNNLVGYMNLVNCLYDVCNHLDVYFKLKDKKFYVEKLWLNINSKNCSNDIHTHYGSMISGVFYVKNSSLAQIVFLNQNQSQVANFHNLSNTENSTANVTSYKLNFTPKDNTFILFPSNQLHYVEQNKTDDDRISIAFNLNVQHIKSDTV